VKPSSDDHLFTCGAIFWAPHVTVSHDDSAVTALHCSRQPNRLGRNERNVKDEPQT